MPSRPILIDCDPGVDDAIALLLALALPDELDLVAVTAVAGNAPLDLTAANARRVLELAGRADVPVHAGSSKPMKRALATAEHVHGETGLDGADLPPPVTPLRDRHAVDVIADEAGNSGGALTLCPLGPLTNVAHALIKRPEAAAGLREIVLMGGAVGRGNITADAEFNVHVDPDAAAIVFDAGASLVMIGLDATRQACITPARLAAIGAIATPVGRAVANLLAHYHRVAGGLLHDPCVIAYLLRPDLFAGRSARVTVETAAGERLGKTVVDFNSARPNAMVVETIDADGFFALLTERLARL